MVTARSAAMAFNRWADARLDAANPRTAARAIPAGILSRGFVGGFTDRHVAGFCSRCGRLNREALLLSPVALAIAPALLLHQAVHPLVASGARPGSRHCPGGCLDRDSRHSGSAHRGAYRGRHFLGRWFRCALRVPGLWRTTRMRPEQHSQVFRYSREPSGLRAPCTSSCWF